MSNNVTVFTQATSIAAATAEGVIGYDTVADLLKVCDGTNWVSLGGGGSVGADSLDFTDFKDAMTLDASTDIATSGTDVLSITNAGTGNSFVVNDTASDTTPFVVDAAGNVGIGTATPGKALDVVGAVRLQAMATNQGIIYTNATGDLQQSPNFGYDPTSNGTMTVGNIQLKNGNYLTFSNGANYTNTSISRIGNGVVGIGTGSAGSSAGTLVANNVGIGTTSPTNVLSLGGDAARTIWMERSATAAAAGNSLTLQAGGTKSGNTDQNGGDLVLSSGTATGTGSSNITFKTAPAGTTGTADRAPATAMTILGNGNVGIGTTSPYSKLHISGGDITLDSGRKIILDYGGGAGSLIYRTGNQILLSSNSGTQSIRIGNMAGGDPLLSLPSVSWSGSTQSSEIPKLSVVGDIYKIATGSSITSWRDTQFIAPTFTGQTATQAITNAATVYVSGAPTAGANATIANAYALWVGGGVTRFDGNVGIGTANPDQAKLEVKGGTVCVDTNSDDDATACITFESDMRLKKNIELIPHALDTLGKLRGVLFDWRWDEIPAIADYKAIGRDAGVIAQEVEAVYPQGMGEELNGYKTVRYDRLIPLLIESVKELKAENDDLKARLKTLERIVLTPASRP